MLDKFHWHEALHTADLINHLVESSLVQHSTYDEIDKGAKALIASVQQNLNLLYLIYCDKQDELGE